MSDTQEKINKNLDGGDTKQWRGHQMSRPSMEEFRKSNVDGVKVIQVIRVDSITGDGDGEPGHSPIRPIVEYFTLDGELLARVDGWKEDTK